MTKYESVLYMQKLQLPGAHCSRFYAKELKGLTNLGLYNLFKSHGLVKTVEDKFGIRTENVKELRYRYPFYGHGTYDVLRSILHSDAGIDLEYIIYAYTSGMPRIMNCHSYLLCDRSLLSYVNSTNLVSNREAFEDPACQSNIWSNRIDYHDPISPFTVARAYLIRASLIDADITDMRVEWSYFKSNRFIFWQCSKDCLIY